MNRTTLILLLALVLFSFGHTSREGDADVSKICLDGTTLYRATPGSGIQVIDVSNPAAPAVLARIPLQSNVDIATSRGYLYADNGPDLIVFDVRNPSVPIPVDTVRSIFADAVAYGWGTGFPGNDVSYGGMQGCGACAASDQPAAPGINQSANGGRGGSMSRFAVAGDRLYCVDYTTVRIIDISDPPRPLFKNARNIGNGIETVFPSGDYLFLGGETGMSIYRRINDDVQYVSKFEHRRSCDPVVVDGDRAYVTLRGGSPCGGNSNQLDILDVSDVTRITLLNSHPLTGPYGLAVRDGIAVICDAKAGLRILDVRNPKQVTELATVTDVIPYDVILGESLLIVTTSDGYILYDARDLRNIHPLGTLH